MRKVRLALLAVLMASLAGVTQGQDAKKKDAKGAYATVEGKTLGNGVFTGVVKDPPEGDRVVIRQLPGPAAPQPASTGRGKGKGKAAAGGMARSNPMEYAFTVGTGASVVFRVLPEAFNDKGEIMRPTPDQLQKLKSGGIPGKLEQVRTGMVLRLTQAGGKVNRVEVLSEVDQPLSKQGKGPMAPKKK